MDYYGPTLELPVGGDNQGKKYWSKLSTCTLAWWSCSRKKLSPFPKRVRLSLQLTPLHGLI